MNQILEKYFFLRARGSIILNFLLKLDQIFSIDKQDGHAPIIFSPSSMLEHHFISAFILLDNFVDNMKSKITSFKLNTSLLKKEDNDGAIQMVTSLCKLCNPTLNPRDMWKVLVESWKKIYQIIGKKQAIDKNKEEKALQSTLNSIKKELQN